MGGQFWRLEIGNPAEISILPEYPVLVYCTEALKLPLQRTRRIADKCFLCRTLNCGSR